MSYKERKQAGWKEWQIFTQVDLDEAIDEARARGASDREIDEVLMFLYRTQDRSMQFSKRGREETDGLARRTAYYSLKAIIPGRKPFETRHEAQRRLKLG